MSSPFVGEIRMFGCNFAPRGWSFCNGQLSSIAQNTALFSLLGTQFGGDGRTTFGLPNLQGRTPLNQGSGPGLTPRSMGESGGQENVTLLVSEIPQHTHTAITTASQPCKNSAGNIDGPAGNFPAQNPAEVFAATSNASMGAGSVTNTLAPNGGGLPHDNLPPYLCLNFCIATQGIYPARN